ncbi:MAG: helix-turn-helix transcriptional regulator [Abitibacteriaceae bacterium]|nr:helix-turn-helix transcriptional regulator [Abditibacteriaceae bacterium]
MRNTRKAKGLTQIEIGSRLGQTQTFVSRYERGERRIDVIELRAICTAMGIPYLKFLRSLETALTNLPAED